MECVELTFLYGLQLKPLGLIYISLNGFPMLFRIMQNTDGTYQYSFTTTLQKTHFCESRFFGDGHLRLGDREFVCHGLYNGRYSLGESSDLGYKLGVEHK
jgi:hypothetical protein